MDIEEKNTRWLMNAPKTIPPQWGFFFFFILHSGKDSGGVTSCYSLKWDGVVVRKPHPQIEVVMN
jgi:hypothetical protein